VKNFGNYTNSLHGSFNCSCKFLFRKRLSRFWHNKIGFEIGGIALKYSVEQWINDGLMAIFFLLIGLEIERELYIGELSDLKSATLPVFAAIGGMATPALFHFLLNRGTETQAGFGIPIATDIAFALGVLALLGKRIPVSLKIFVASLAIIDDLGSIFIIALFYTSDLSFIYLVFALGIFTGLVIINRLRVHRLIFYLIPGFFMWYFMLKSGIHPTIAGVLLAFAIPFASGDKKSPSYKLQHFLHRPVSLYHHAAFCTGKYWHCSNWKLDWMLGNIQQLRNYRRVVLR